MSLSLKIVTLALGVIAFKLLWSVSGQSVVIGDKQYLVVTEQKFNWYKAYQTCAQLGMSLASIESEDEYKSLNDFLYGQSILSNAFWLSGTNLADKGIYSWQSTGKPFSFTKWAPNQPGTLANRCIYTTNKIGWLTDDCYTAKYFVCTKPVTPTCGPSGRCTKRFQLAF